MRFLLQCMLGLEYSYLTHANQSRLPADKTLFNSRGSPIPKRTKFSFISAAGGWVKAQPPPKLAAGLMVGLVLLGLLLVMLVSAIITCCNKRRARRREARQVCPMFFLSKFTGEWQPWHKLTRASCA